MLNPSVKAYKGPLNRVAHMDTTLLENLDADSLLALAKAYEDFARKARARACELRLRQQSLIDINHRLNSLHSIGPQMADLLNQREYKYVQKNWLQTSKSRAKPLMHIGKSTLNSATRQQSTAEKGWLRPLPVAA